MIQIASLNICSMVWLQKCYQSSGLNNGTEIIIIRCVYRFQRWYRWVKLMSQDESRNDWLISLIFYDKQCQPYRIQRSNMFVSTSLPFELYWVQLIALLSLLLNYTYATPIFSPFTYKDKLNLQYFLAWTSNYIHIKLWDIVISFRA